MSGRCIQLPGERTKWVSHKPPGAGEDSWKLPGNVPTHDIHLRHQPPPGTQIKSCDWNHVGELVSHERTVRCSLPIVPLNPDDFSKLSPGHCKTPWEPHRDKFPQLTRTKKNSLVDPGTNPDIHGSDASIVTTDPVPHDKQKDNLNALFLPMRSDER